MRKPQAANSESELRAQLKVSARHLEGVKDKASKLTAWEGDLLWIVDIT